MVALVDQQSHLGGVTIDASIMQPVSTIGCVDGCVDVTLKL